MAKAAPDGHTLLLGPSGALTIQPTVNAKLPYDPQHDFEPVSQLTSGPQVIAVHPGVAAKSVHELIALAKAKPGQLNYASGGAGTANHLAAEVFKLAAGIDVVHIPYKGTGPALTSVLSGESQMIISSLLPALPHVKSGKLRALAVTSTSRSAAVPDVPTAADSGLPKFETSSSWHSGSSENAARDCHAASWRACESAESARRAGAPDRARFECRCIDSAGVCGLYQIGNDQVRASDQAGRD